jgi:hypothetical protein
MKAPHRETRSVASLGDVFGAELAKIAAARVDGLPLSRRGVMIDCSCSPASVLVFALDERRSDRDGR